MAKKVQLGYKDIEKRLQAIKPAASETEEIGYRLLCAFGKSEKDIARYEEGKGVLKTFDGLLIKGLFCYKGTATHRLTEELERLKSDTQVQKAAPKIVAVSDGTTLLAYDLREKDTYENPLDRLYCDFAFFYPLMDVEHVHYVEENPAGYNTFPFPKISAEKKAAIAAAAEDVLVTREFYPEKTLAELYDPDKMPQNLREAHARLDDIVESCYPGYPFQSDEARLECLSKLYEKMTAKVRR